MKKNYKRILGIALTLIIILALVLNKLGWFDANKQTEGVVVSRSNITLPVKAIIVKSSPLKDVLVASGSIYADEQVDIAAETSGRIIKIHFTEGSKVNAGDLLVTINNADLKAQIERNNSKLLLATERETRQLKLLSYQGISQETYDQALTELNGFKAEAALLEAQLDKTMIKAPFGGLLGLRYLSEGSFVSTGTKIVHLSKNQPIKIEFTVPERYTSYIKKGNSIKFSVENQVGNFDASIYATEPVVDQRSRSLTVRARYDNPTESILPGTFTRVELPLEHLIDAIQVPSEALIPEMGNNKLFVYRNGKAQPVLVAIGLRTSNRVQITDGISVGDTVLVTGLLQLRPGMSIELTQID